MQRPEPGHQRGGRLREEPAESGRVRIALQSSEVLEEPVGAKQPRGLEPLDPQADGVEHGQHEFPRAVVAVAPVARKLLRQCTLQADRGHKPVQ